MNEFVIWGIPSGQDKECLLLTQWQGKNITDYMDAAHCANVLRTTHRCKSVRIQEIDLTNGFNKDFANTVNV